MTLAAFFSPSDQKAPILKLTTQLYYNGDPVSIDLHLSNGKALRLMLLYFSYDLKCAGQTSLKKQKSSFEWVI